MSHFDFSADFQMLLLQVESEEEGETLHSSRLTFVLHDVSSMDLFYS